MKEIKCESVGEFLTALKTASVTSSLKKTKWVDRAKELILSVAFEKSNKDSTLVSIHIKHCRVPGDASMNQIELFKASMANQETKYLFLKALYA